MALIDCGKLAGSKYIVNFLNKYLKSWKLKLCFTTQPLYWFSLISLIIICGFIHTSGWQMVRYQVESYGANAGKCVKNPLDHPMYEICERHPSMLTKSSHIQGVSIQWPVFNKLSRAHFLKYRHAVCCKL